MAFFRKLTKHKNTQKLEHDACLPIKFLFNDRFCDQLLGCIPELFGKAAIKLYG